MIFLSSGPAHWSCRIKSAPYSEGQIRCTMSSVSRGGWNFSASFWSMQCNHDLSISHSRFSCSGLQWPKQAALVFSLEVCQGFQEIVLATWHIGDVHWAHHSVLSAEWITHPEGIFLSQFADLFVCIARLGCGLSYHKRCAYKIPKNCNNNRRGQCYRPLSGAEAAAAAGTRLSTAVPAAAQVCCTLASYC